MKRIRIILIVFAALLVACSKPTLEDKAYDRIRPAVELFVNDPTSAIIQDEKTVYSSDSICVIQFVLKAKNSFGGYVSDRIEYYIKKGTDKNGQFTDNLYECIYSLDEHKSILKMAQDFSDKLQENDSLFVDPNTLVYTYSIIQKAICGERLVEP